MTGCSLKENGAAGAAIFTFTLMVIGSYLASGSKAGAVVDIFSSQTRNSPLKSRAGTEGFSNGPRLSPVSTWQQQPREFNSEKQKTAKPFVLRLAKECCCRRVT